MTRLVLGIVAVLMVTGGVAAAAPPSVFFGETARRATDRAWAEGEDARKGRAEEKQAAESEQEKLPGAEEKEAPDPVTLTGLLYLGRTSWSVWLNGTRYTPDKAPGPWRIVEVTRDWVEMVHEDAEGEIAHHVRLRPRQTYMPRSKAVRYGPPPQRVLAEETPAGEAESEEAAGAESPSDDGADDDKTARAPELPDTLSPEMRKALDRADDLSGRKRQQFKVEP